MENLAWDGMIAAMFSGKRWALDVLGAIGTIRPDWMRLFLLLLVSFTQIPIFAQAQNVRTFEVRVVDADTGFDVPAEIRLASAWPALARPELTEGVRASNGCRSFLGGMGSIYLRVHTE